MKEQTRWVAESITLKKSSQKYHLYIFRRNSKEVTYNHREVALMTMIEQDNELLKGIKKATLKDKVIIVWMKELSNDSVFIR